MTVKPDEIAFEAALRAERAEPTEAHPTTDAISNRLGIPRKRAWYILEKWSDKGKWDYGVTPRTGWFTDRHLDD